MTSHTASQAFTLWQRQISTEALVWNDLTILLSFEADWLGRHAAGLPDPCSLIELQVVRPAGAPMPLSAEGYWSEFLEPGVAEEAGGPAAVAISLLEEFSQSQTWRVAWARWELQEDD